MSWSRRCHPVVPRSWPSSARSSANVSSRRAMVQASAVVGSSVGWYW
ncbi:hypothetical protein ACFFX0_20955 [Citricoccus parietis]|uniref:Twin-arginine translocation signal domain-containing protein n=1 Tax=Citricoccus parietis TaxID=592307 RepID=A0ABV5G3L1_9MICC